MADGRLSLRDNVTCISQRGEESKVLLRGTRAREGLVCLNRGELLEGQTSFKTRTGINWSSFLSRFKITPKGSIALKEKVDVGRELDMSRAEWVEVEKDGAAM